MAEAALSLLVIFLKVIQCLHLIPMEEQAQSQA